MAFNLTQFQNRRPYLYHLTSTVNLDRIRLLNRLESATTLRRLGGQALNLQRRINHEEFVIDNLMVSVRDQIALISRNIEFNDGLMIENLNEILNERVFFWPGTIERPIPTGMRHFQRYEQEQPAVLRIETQRLFDVNNIQPSFCKYNSGGPRCSRGRRSPRGNSTFLPADQNDYNPSDVVEVTFVGNVLLPDNTQIKGETWTQWNQLFPQN